MLFLCKITESLKIKHSRSSFKIFLVFKKISHVEKGKPNLRYKYLFYQDPSFNFSFNMYLLSIYYMSVPVLQQNRNRNQMYYQGSFHTEYQLVGLLNSVTFPTDSYGILKCFLFFFVISCLKRFLLAQTWFSFLLNKAHDQNPTQPNQTKPNQSPNNLVNLIFIRTEILTNVFSIRVQKCVFSNGRQLAD